MSNVFIILIYILFLSTAYANFSVLNAKRYNLTVNESRNKITKILYELKFYRDFSADKRLAWIVDKLTDIPYLNSNAMGEGDWQPASLTYEPGAIHINQNPVYRLDGLNCQTFVQNVLALFISTDINEFDANIIKIAYGAAGNPHGERVRFYNRNNFIDADFNPVNQKQGLLRDITKTIVFTPYTKNLYIHVNRQQWFLNQQKNLLKNVQVLSKTNGNIMIKRFISQYSHLNFANFSSEDITLRYIPKEFLAVRQRDGNFHPNQSLLDKIPTPAIAQIVRDIKKWHLAISHFGLLYRQNFNKGEIIYQKISCYYGKKYKKICVVSPIVCKENICHELMFAHATNAYPNSYFWYVTNDGNYVCRETPPPKHVKYTYCNRVMSKPFYDYLTDYQFGSYSNMANTILGVHIESVNLIKSL